MVVGSFRRSLSFPNNPNRPSKPRKTFHVRSTSLPCRSHPLISQLKDELTELRTWGSNPNSARTSAWLCDGLSRLRTIHESLDDILGLPQTHDSLRHHSDTVEKLLEDFLRFIDVYGMFQTLIMTLQQEQMAAQVATRRRDDSKIALYVKAMKKMAKEMSKLMSTVRSIGRCPVPVPIDDTELGEVIRDVNEVTVLVSVTVFNGISSSFTSQKSSWMGLKLAKRAKKVKVEEGIEEFQQVGVDSLWGLRKKGDEEVRMVLKKMHELEDCICGIESGSEKVFRSLINTRVSLLNVLTQ
ncbi:uncharacterized protein LOC132280097 [Cornus florida]|uniref:uncharacterized protein LOC132280097 n=1 Tax=Cornus florida TaxID=4283 RepID=UPI00289BFC67|nr:uncharacterized protein LOC132280097 [Cornus florida]